MDVDNTWTIVPKKNKNKPRNKNKKKSKQTTNSAPAYSVPDTSDYHSNTVYLTNNKKRPHVQHCAYRSKSGIRMTDVDEDVAEMSHKSLRRSVKQAIIKSRNQKKLTRNQLAQRCNVKPAVIAEYEVGNPIPDKQLLHKLQKCLGVRLMGKESNIGRRIK